MMTYVLLVILSSSSPAVLTQRFPNKESCDSARLWLDNHASPTTIQSVCLEDLREEPPATEGDNQYGIEDSSAEPHVPLR
jgi:hypothetical protein